MIKKLITCLLTCSVIIMFTSCKDDEASSPAKPSFTVDQTSGLINDTEFTFTINQVNADAVTLYPYGLAKAGLGTVPVTFDGGSATVTFTYTEAGSFDAVVVSNNHNDDGTSIKNSTSEPITITLTSDVAEISDFTLDYIISDDEVVEADSVEIDQGAGTITVYVPYAADVTDLTATFTASPFATVSVSGTTQTSGESSQNFTTPKTYTVTADDGVSSNAYVVTVIQQAVETNTDVKTFSGVLFSKSLVNDGAGKAIPGYIDNSGGYIVLYAHDITTADKDSVSVSYELDGKFATTDLDQGDSLNLTTSKSFTVTAEDGSTQDYDIYAVLAPTIEFSLNDLNPVVTGIGNDFSLDLKVLSQTGDVVNVYRTASSVPAGVSITGYSITNGEAVDFSDGPVEVEVYVSDSNIGENYTVTYTLNLIKQ